jgi:peptidoglycan hydrolase-like protein with peptidoglycan-binding domain
VRERSIRARAQREDDDYDLEWSWRSRLLAWMRHHPKDAAASFLAAFAATAILINALFLQSGPHPAPIFANRPPPLPIRTDAPGHALVPRPRPADAPVTATARGRAETITEIQRELSKRGFYDGTPDGVYGPKTDAAIRDFEHTAGLRASAEPNETLLAAIVRSNVKAKPSAPASARPDPIAELLAPSRRVTAVQRALTDYGYGQIKPTGIYGPETRIAIERFERERRLPVTGQLSERLTRELSAMTGRPLD